MSTATLDLGEVNRRLNDVIDPCSVASGMPLGLPEMGLVAGVDVEGSHLDVRIRLSSPGCYMLGYFTDEIRDRLLPMSGIDSVDVHFDEGFEWDASFMSEEVKERRRLKFLQLDTTARRHGTVHSHVGVGRPDAGEGAR